MTEVKAGFFGNHSIIRKVGHFDDMLDPLNGTWTPGPNDTLEFNPVVIKIVATAQNSGDVSQFVVGTGGKDSFVVEIPAKETMDLDQAIEYVETTAMSHAEAIIEAVRNMYQGKALPDFPEETKAKLTEMTLKLNQPETQLLIDGIDEIYKKVLPFLMSPQFEEKIKD